MGIFKRTKVKMRHETPAEEKRPEATASLNRTDAPIASVRVKLNTPWLRQPPAGVECLLPIFEDENGHDYEWEALFRSQGAWYLHREAYWANGAGGDAGGLDTPLPMVTNENAEAWAEKRKRYAPMQPFLTVIQGQSNWFERLPEGEIHVSQDIRSAKAEGGRPDVTLPADYLLAHSVEEMYQAVAGQNVQSANFSKAEELARLQASLKRCRWMP